MSEENIGGEEGIIEERRKKLQILRDKNKAYVNNFFNVLGNTEKLTVLNSIWIPLLILATINIFFIRRINEK